MPKHTKNCYNSNVKMVRDQCKLFIIYQFWCLGYLTLFPTWVSADFLDWFWTNGKRVDASTTTNGPFISVPFEYKTEDEKFLEEASKFTDLMKTSSLDVCQHKVILQVKTSCFSMTEEELAKLSVNLLNCQSQVDGRRVFPCTESMSLAECTKDMDANIWNAYHLMNNRARAVCLAARRTQFQALSEMTVNKLMATAHDQINKMTSLLEGQEKLESLTVGTLNSVEKGHVQLMEQQENLKKAQNEVQEFVTLNLKQLTSEKALIAAGNKELSEMTKSIQEKLEKANQQMITQYNNRTKNHQQLLADIQRLQIQTHEIFRQIDSSTEKLLEQHQVASKSYQTAVSNLVKINDTVFHLLQMVNLTRAEVDSKLQWIQGYLDGTENQIEKVMSVTFHIVYLLVGMLFASFLNVSNTSRALLAIVVPLNLGVTYKRGPETAMTFSQMTIVLTSTVLAIGIVHALWTWTRTTRPRRTVDKLDYRNGRTDCQSGEEELHKSRDKPAKNSFGGLKRLLTFLFGWIGKKSRGSPSSAASASRAGTMRQDENFVSSSYRDSRNEELSHWEDYTPVTDRYQHSVNSRVNEWLQSKVDYPRSGSPSSSTGSASPRFYCSAVCRSGRRCRNTAFSGRLCHRHLAGSPVDG